MGENSLKEISELVHEQSYLNFQTLQFEYINDIKGQSVLAFSDGIHAYFIPQSATIPILAPERDEIFMMGAGTAVLVSHVNPSSPNIFVLGLHNYSNSPIARVIDRDRDEILNLLKRIDQDSVLLPAIQVIPQFESGYPSTFVVPTIWDPASIIKPLRRESDEDYQRRVLQLHNPLEVKTVITSMPDPLRTDLGDRSLNMRVLTMFGSFYATASDEQKRTIEQVYLAAKAGQMEVAFINAFSACEGGWEVGSDIIDLMDKSYRFRALVAYERLRQLEYHFFSQFIEVTANLLRIDRTRENWEEPLKNLYQKINPDTFRCLLANRRSTLLKQAANHEPNWPLFERENILLGALFRSILEASPIADLPAKTQELMGGFEARVSVIHGRGDLILSADLEEMDKERNYPHPEIFSAHDYRGLCKLISGTYSDTDPELRDVLIRKIPQDLTNSEVNFALIRKGKELITSHKMRPAYDGSGQKIPGVYYSGNLYVARELREVFGFGEAAINLSFSMVPDMKKRLATCDLSNPALFIHLHKRGGIGSDLIREEDEFGGSDDMLQILFAPENGVYSSKSYSKDQVLGLINTQSDGPIVALRVNSSLDHKMELAQLLRDYFNRDYILANVLYETDFDGKADLTQTYLVFEKRREVSDQSSSTLA